MISHRTGRCLSPTYTPPPTPNNKNMHIHTHTHTHFLKHTHIQSHTQTITQLKAWTMGLLQVQWYYAVSKGTEWRAAWCPPFITLHIRPYHLHIHILLTTERGFILLWSVCNTLATWGERWHGVKHVKAVRAMTRTSHSSLVSFFIIFFALSTPPVNVHVISHRSGR